MRTPAGLGMCAFRASASTPGRIAAATMKPRNRRAMTILIFQSASASTTIAMTTIVTTAARRATCPMARVLPRSVEACNPMPAHGEEQVWLEERRHGIVLVRPLVRASGLAAVGVAGIVVGWPATVAGAFLLVAAAVAALAAVWRWDRTHV